MRNSKDEYNDLNDEYEEFSEKDLREGFGDSIKSLMSKNILLPRIPNKKKDSSKENEIERELNSRERQLLQKEKELSLRESDIERKQQEIIDAREQNESNAKKISTYYEDYKNKIRELSSREEDCQRREQELAEKEIRLNEKYKAEEDKAKNEEQKIQEIYEKNERNIIVKEQQLELNREIVELSVERKSYRLATLDRVEDVLQKITEIRDSFFELNDCVVDAKKKISAEYYYSTVVELCKFYRTLCTDDLIPYAQTLENILIHEYGVEKYTAQEGEIFNDKKHKKLDKSNPGSIIDSTIYEGWKIDNAVIIRAVVEVREEDYYNV